MGLLLIHAFLVLVFVGFASSTLVDVKVSGRPGQRPSHISIRGFRHESTYTLSKPTDSIFFSRGVTIGINEEGRYKHEPVPSQTLEDIDNRLYVDDENDAIFHIGDDHKITGVMGHLSITPHDNNNHGNYTNTHKILGDSSKLHHIREKRNVRPEIIKNTLEIEPEIWVVLDYGNSKIFNFDRKAILEYLAVYMHAVSIPFKKIKEFRTTLKVTNVTITMSLDQNPYSFTRHKQNTPIGPVHLAQPGVFQDFGYWVWKKLDGAFVYKETESEWIPDIAMLLISERMASKKTGEWDTTGGLAVVGGICNRNVDWPSQISLVYSTQGVPNAHSTHAASHEIGHLLGSPHDGDKGIMKACDKEDGYMLSSSKIRTQNRYVFSKCSVGAMLDNIRRNGGCLRKRGSSGIISLSNKQLPGSLYPDMKTFCQKKYPGFPNNRPTDGKTPEELCYWMTCQFMDPMEKAYIDKRDTRDPAPDGLPCGNRRICFEGKCLDERNVPKL